VRGNLCIALVVDIDLLANSSGIKIEKFRPCANFYVTKNESRNVITKTSTFLRNRQVTL
jgi:hypothetical protein